MATTSIADYLPPALHPKPPAEALTPEALTDEAVSALVLHYMEIITAPFQAHLAREKAGEMTTGREVPFSGIWHSNPLALYLSSLGDGMVFWEGAEMRADKLLARLKEERAFYKPRAPEAYWAPDRDPGQFGGVHPTRLVMKTEAVAAEAFRSLIAPKNFVFMECLGAMDLAYSLAVLDIVGDDRFNALAARVPRVELGDRSCENRVLTPFLEAMPPITQPKNPKKKKGAALKFDYSKLKVGQMVHVNGHPDYNAKHRHGSSQAVNVIYAGEGKFIGFDFPPEGVTMEEIYKHLYAAFIAEPLPDEALFPPGEGGRSVHLAIGGTSVAIPFSQIRACMAGKVLATDIHPELTLEVVREDLYPVVQEQDGKDRWLARSKSKEKQFYGDHKARVKATDPTSALSASKILAFMRRASAK